MFKKTIKKLINLIIKISNTNEKIQADIASIKVFLKYILLTPTDKEKILWLDDMPIGVKGLHIKKINALEEKVSVIEDNTIYDLDNMTDGNKTSEILEIVRKIYFKQGYETYVLS